ncbi:Hypothetical protein CINCED_3A020599 [Cinara cedri]|uniref:Uncharacterized protein n=1 Tax=Cinara cedri TaxID=506608 RepID=A0A5E4MHR5_9HEMI|nr:Hypothetical protein CINCED_3A020599 [Cinara cedri]
MSDLRKRRSSFFQKPVEESTEKELELFEGMDWVLAESKEITSKSLLFGDQGKKILKEYADKLKSRELEHTILISYKQEEIINLKEKLRKKKVELNWETACEGLTDFEKDFVNNRPDYKSLVQKVHLLTLKTCLAKKANDELNAISNAFIRRGNEQIHKLQEVFIDQIIEDSGVSISYNDSNVDSSTTESEDECLNSNSN